jgi:hypothetical protein
VIFVEDKLVDCFLRGCFDGDGCNYSYWDPRWKSSFIFYVEFSSAGKEFIGWLRSEITKKRGNRTYYLNEKEKFLLSTKICKTGSTRNYQENVL